MHESHVMFSHASNQMMLAITDGQWHPFGSAASANYISVYPAYWERLPDEALWTIVWSSEADGANPNCVALALITGADGHNELGPQIRTELPEFGPHGLDVTEWLTPYLAQARSENWPMQIGQQGCACSAKSPMLYQSRLSFLWTPQSSAAA